MSNPEFKDMLSTVKGNRSVASSKTTPSIAMKNIIFSMFAVTYNLNGNNAFTLAIRSFDIGRHSVAALCFMVKANFQCAHADTFGLV